MSLPTIGELDLNGDDVVLRVDFNVPMKDGAITSTQRIVAALPTIRAAKAAGARAVVLMSHL